MFQVRLRKWRWVGHTLRKPDYLTTQLTNYLIRQYNTTVYTVFAFLVFYYVCLDTQNYLHSYSGNKDMGHSNNCNRHFEKPN